MMLTVGEKLPTAALEKVMSIHLKSVIWIPDYFVGRKVALVGLNGAFTPVCSARHINGFEERADELFAAGVEEIIAITCDNPYVLGAWADQKKLPHITWLSDGNNFWAKKAELETYLPEDSLGYVMKRFSAFVENNIIKILNIEEDNNIEVSDARTLLRQIKASEK